MTDDVPLDGAMLPEEQRNLTPTEFRRFQVALALQLELSTGRRTSENLSLVREAVAKHLGHTSTETVRFSIQDSGRRSARREKPAILNLPEPTDYIEAPCVLAKVSAAWGKAAPVSPFCRVHEDMNAADALSSHLGALRGQLGEDS